MKTSAKRFKCLSKELKEKVKGCEIGDDLDEEEDEKMDSFHTTSFQTTSDSIEVLQIYDDCK